MTNFSVIIPSYNSEEFISWAIDSVINQSYKEWELIVVDDNSSDKTWQILLNYKKQSKKIKVYRLPFTQGAANARNFAVKKSIGRYIAFLDSDDYWLPDKLKYQYLAFEKYKCPIIFSYYYVIKSRNNETRNIVKAPQKVYFKNIINSNSICTSTSVYDTFILGKQYMPDLRQRHDWALWMKILKMDSNFYAYCLDKPLAIRLEHNKSLSSNVVRSLYFNYLVLKRYSGLKTYRAFFNVIRNIILVFIKRFKSYFHR
tara:strand:- start:43 stop:813 length:771 start_codon:yes stop_codon:yes gene_type:complete